MADSKCNECNEKIVTTQSGNEAGHKITCSSHPYQQAHKK